MRLSMSMAQTVELLFRIDSGACPTASEREMLNCCQELILSDEKLRAIPKSLGMLENLQRLFVLSPYISSFPENLVLPSRLTYISVSCQGITAFPECVTRLPLLKTLLFRDTGIAELPKTIGNLTQLDTLVLSGTGIRELPEELCSLPRLRILDLSNTPLHRLPEHIGQLRALRVLNVERTQVEVLPESLGQIRGLQKLYMSLTPVSAIPDSMDVGKLPIKEAFDGDSPGIYAAHTELISKLPSSGRTETGAEKTNPGRPQGKSESARHSPAETDGESVGRPTVFLSYNWSNMEFVDQLEQALAPYARVLRDKTSVAPWESLSLFMQSIRKADYVVLVISPAYLRSRACLYEVSQLMQEPDWRTKALFVVMEGSSIYSPAGRAEYIRHWQSMAEALETTIKALPPSATAELNSDLRTTATIRDYIGGFLGAAADSCNPNPAEAIREVVERVQSKRVSGYEQCN